MKVGIEMKHIILILILLSALANVNSREYFEKGDALYREKRDIGGMSFGHSGICWFWDTNMDPTKREAHWQIESSIDIGNHGVEDSTFQYFYWRTEFWSVRSETFRLKYAEQAIV